MAERGCTVIDAGTDYIRRDAALPSMTSYSIGGWVKFSGITGTQTYHNIVIMVDSADTYYQVAGVRDVANPDPFVLAYSSGNQTVWSDYTQRIQGNWCYVGMCCDGTAIGDLEVFIFDEYFDLIATGSNPSSLTVAAMGFAEIGTYHVYSNEHAPGKYAEWRMWDRKLTQGEFLEEARSCFPVRTKDLNTAWFVDPTTDVSGNGRGWSVNGVTQDYTDWPPSTFPRQSTKDRGCFIITAEPPGYTTSTDDVYRQDASLPDGDSFALGAWVKWLIDNGSSYQTPLSVINSTKGWGAHLQFNGASDEVRVGNESGSVLVYDSPEIGVWYYGALSCDGNAADSIDCYLFDRYGNLLGSGVRPGSVSQIWRARLGNYADGLTEVFNGKIAQARFWATPKTEAEFRAELYSPTPVIVDSLYNAINYKPDEDISQNGRPWGINGSIDIDEEDWPPNMDLYQQSVIVGTIASASGLNLSVELVSDDG